MRNFIINVLVPLAAPMLLVNGCMQGDDPDSSVSVLSDDPSAGIAAEYRTGSDVVRLATRRIDIQVSEADGTRTEQYVEVGPDATDFQVELTMLDVGRDIRLTARADQVWIDSDAASAADKDRAMALFGDALYAVDAAIQLPTTERRLFLDLADAASTHPGFQQPVAESDDQGCVGTNDPMTFATTTVNAHGVMECIKAGTYKASMCIRAQQHPTWWNWQTELGCHETAKGKYDEPADGGNIKIDVTADIWCGDLGKTYEYEPHLRAVQDFNSWKNFFIGDDWHTLAQGPTADHTCGIGG
jgi:hypothetical protein